MRVVRRNRVVPFGDSSTRGSVGSLLSKLFQAIMRDLGIEGDRYDGLMRRYIQKSYFDLNRKTKTAARASLSKELLKATMTWKTFIKGLNFLSVVKFELRLKLHHANGKVTQHGLDVVLAEVDSDSQEPGE